MLVARVAPPLPNGESPRTVLSGARAERHVVEIVARLSGALARGLAADLQAFGYEIAWVRPLPFEADGGSLAPLLVMALSAARHAAPGGDGAVVVVVESPTATQADVLLDQMPAPETPFGPDVILLAPEERERRARPASVIRVPPARPPRGEAGARAEAVTRRLLRDASAPQLASLEMASHLGYAHHRFRSLELVLPPADRSAPPGRPQSPPWWVPLEDGWWQVDPAWRRPLASCAAETARTARSACVGRLVAELVESDAVSEGIELCIDAGWPGLAADLLAGEAEALLSAGRHLTVASWLERIPAADSRCHPGLAALAADLVPAEPPREPRRPPEPPRRPWVLRMLGRRSGGDRPPLGRPVAEVIPCQPEPCQAEPGSRPGPGGQPAPDQSQAPVRLEARLLGPFEVLVQGRPVPHWTGNRGRMLLAFLLLHRDRPLSRGELGCAFWPDAEPGTVRNRLHVALHGLRKDLRAVTPHPVVVHGQRGFALDPDVQLWTDVETFDAAIAAAKRDSDGREGSGRGDRTLEEYEKAIALYRGELIADAPFEEWVLLHRERLRLAYLEALDQVASLRFDAGRYEDCLEACQLLLPGDICREEIHRMAMRCYARLNRPHLAARQYHLCERQLQGELGVGPADATRHLYDQIRHREFV